MSNGKASLKILTPEQKEQFLADGYLLIENLFDPAEVFTPIKAEQSAILDKIVAGLLAKGQISSSYSDLPFEERLMTICAESGRNFPQHFDITLPLAKDSIRPDTPIHTGAAIFNLLSHPRLLDVAEDIVGTEIYCNPVQHIRMKLPDKALTKRYYNALIGKVSWHQDNGVILPEADAVNMLTIWMPLTEATLENGCLAVLPGSHKLGLLQHCQTSKDVAIPDALLPDITPKPLPMSPGSVLLMSKLMVHCSLDNKTENEVRISADLRYQPTNQPTGRPAFAPAGFIARSAANPSNVLRDANIWQQNWFKVRDEIASQTEASYFKTNRWTVDAVCA